MAIRKISLKNDSWQPGECLSQAGGEYMHVTISYDITGMRNKIDHHIHEVIESSHDLRKIECVNTTIYWQARLGDRYDNQDMLVMKAEIVLKNKLEEIFVKNGDLSYETVTAYCMIGNLRAFAFEIDA
ncbi:hypothetical protein [Pseudomonas sp. NPDC086251]|uniref:hypothetical protein n=1 Tax=Pseudomonas sp. NPDC086251 TaxID=3364431 RepID=UPI0038336B1F